FSGEDRDITIHDQAAVEKMEMNGVLAVARGSDYAPAFVELTYCTDPSKPLVALVGKGVTFDTGGISLKGGRNISDMRMDMGGAAAVADALPLLVMSEAHVNVVDIATLTGAIGTALGSKLAGVFGDEQLATDMKQIGDHNGEFNWPMPLVDAYDRYLRSDYADVSNISNKGEAGAITAGLFLRN